MIFRLVPLQTLLVTTFAISLVTGCGQSGSENAGKTEADEKTSQASGAEADPHDMPLTEQEVAQLQKETARYEDALAHIQTYQQTIQRETTEGEPPKAHRALDKLDIVLERLPAAARDSGVAKNRWQEVNETAQTLRDLFNEVHANIDAGTTPDYESVAERIEQGIATLAAIEPQDNEEGE